MLVEQKKSEKYKGHTIKFQKQYKFVSNDFPASPFYIGFIDGREAVRGFTKAETFDAAKRVIDNGNGCKKW